MIARGTPFEPGSLLDLWQSVTFGQALVLAAGVFLAVRLVEIVADGVRALAGRRTSADEATADELVQHAERAADAAEHSSAALDDLVGQAEQSRAAVAALVDLVSIDLLAKVQAGCDATERLVEHVTGRPTPFEWSAGSDAERDGVPCVRSPECGSDATAGDVR